MSVVLDEFGRIAMLAAHEAQLKGIELALTGMRDCTAHSAEIRGLQDDRKRQNGTLERLEEKLDGLIFKMLAAAGAFLLAFGLAAAGWIVMLLKH